MGDFLGDPNFWGRLAPPSMGVGGQGSCRSVDLFGGNAQKIRKKSKFGVSRKFDFSLFPLGRHCWRQVEKRTGYDSDDKVLNTRRDRSR